MVGLCFSTKTILTSLRLLAVILSESVSSPARLVSFKVVDFGFMLGAMSNEALQIAELLQFVLALMNETILKSSTL
jgi:hypothetical protein